MKNNNALTFEFLTECFSVDFQHGLLFWKKRPMSHFATAAACKTFNSATAGSRAGSLRPDGRRQLRICGCRVFTYRVIYALHRRLHLNDVPVVIDHRNGDPSFDGIENLRAATPQTNQFNRRSKAGTKSRFKGVSLAASGRWRAAICVRGYYESLGTYTSEEAAARAYDEAAIRLHGDFARLQVM